VPCLAQQDRENIFIVSELESEAMNIYFIEDEEELHGGLHTLECSLSIFRHFYLFTLTSKISNLPP